MKYIFPLFLLLLFTPVISGQMTLDDAIRLGLNSNYDIIIAYKNAEISNNNIQKGKAELLPTIDFNAQYQRSDINTDTGNPIDIDLEESSFFNTAISLDYTIFDGLQMFIQRDQYEKLAELGELNTQIVVENKILEISRAFFNLVRQELLLDIAIRSTAVSSTRLNKEELRNELGASSSTDLLNARVSYNNDQAAIINQRLQVSIAKEQLNVLFGRDPKEPLKVRKEIDIPALDLTIEEIENVAYQKNSRFLAAQVQNEIKKLNVENYKSEFYPVISFFSSMGYADNDIKDNTSNGDYFETQAGFRLRLNLFNGKRDTTNLKNARVEKEIQTLILANLKNELDGDIQQKYDTFTRRIELLELEIENVEAAQQNLKLQQDRFQIGATSSLEFRDAQINLNRAETTLISAQYEARIALLEIQRLMGKIIID